MQRTLPPIASLLVLLAAPATRSQGGGEAPSHEDLAGRIEAYLAPFVADGHLSGTVLVARGEDIVFHQAFGMANYEHGVRNRVETRHCIASITKSMTKILAIQMIERGELGLRDPISKWLPEFPRAERITIEHLLRHRAGIPHRVTTAEQETLPRTAADMVGLVEACLADDRAFLCDPGETSNYSSAGYSVLARILELVAQKPFATLLRERIFEPAGMKRSIDPNGRDLVADRAQSYLPAARGPRNAPQKDLSFLVGAGSVYSTARDLLACQATLRKGGYGRGATASLVEPTGITMNGATNGFRAYCDHHAASDVSVVVLANLTTGALDRMRSALPRIAAGESVDTPARFSLTPVELPAAELEAYSGVFVPRAGSEFHLRVEAGQLMIGTYLLVPLGNDRFLSIQDYAEIRVARDEGGKITHLDWGDTVMQRADR